MSETDKSKGNEASKAEPALRAEEIAAIERLTEEVARFNGHRFVKVHNSRWRMALFSLSRGLAFGLGTVLGGGLLVSILGWWAAQFEFLPVIGEWASQLVKEIERLN